MRFSSVVIIVLFSLSSSCSRRQIQPTPHDLSAGALVAHYQKLLQKQISFRGLAEITRSSKTDGKQSCRVVWESKPGELHLRGFTLFGGTLFDIRRIGTHYSWEIPAKRQSGEADQSELERRSDIPFKSLDLLGWIERRGIPNIPAWGATPAGDRVTVEINQTEIVLHHFPDREEIETETIWVDRNNLLVRKVALYRLGHPTPTLIKLGDYRRVGAYDFPFQVEGESEEERLQFRFKEISLILSPTLS